MIYIKSFLAAWKFWVGYIIFAAAWGSLVGVIEGWPGGNGWWFGIVTAATVGYGDMSPETTAGRVVTAVALIIGGIYLIATIVVNAVHAKDAWTDAEQRRMFTLLAEIVDRLARLEKRASDAAKQNTPPEEDRPEDRGGSSSWLDALRRTRRGTPVLWDDNDSRNSQLGVESFRRLSTGPSQGSSARLPAEGTWRELKHRERSGRPTPTRHPDRSEDTGYAPSPFIVGATPGIAYGGSAPSAPDCSPSPSPDPSPSPSPSSYDGGGGFGGGDTGSGCS
jgi:hypothetical protein